MINMKFVVDFVGEIDAKDWKDAQQKIFVVLEELDKHFEQFDLSLEESENEKCIDEIIKELM